MTRLLTTSEAMEFLSIRSRKVFTRLVANSPYITVYRRTPDCKDRMYDPDELLSLQMSWGEGADKVPMDLREWRRNGRKPIHRGATP